MTPADRDLADAVEAMFDELRDDGATESELIELADYLSRGLDALAAELAQDAATVYAAGDEVPEHLPRLLLAAEFDQGDPRLIVERFNVAGRPAERRWRIGEMRRRALRFT